MIEFTDPESARRMCFAFLIGACVLVGAVIGLTIATLVILKVAKKRRLGRLKPICTMNAARVLFKKGLAFASPQGTLVATAGELVFKIGRKVTFFNRSTHEVRFFDGFPTMNRRIRPHGSLDVAGNSFVEIGRRGGIQGSGTLFVTDTYSAWKLGKALAQSETGSTDSVSCVRSALSHNSP